MTELEFTLSLVLILVFSFIFLKFFNFLAEIILYKILGIKKGKIKKISAENQVALPKTESISKTPLTIKLWHMTGMGLIIPTSSGIVYSNQVGGYAVLGPKIEGALFPFSSLEMQNVQESCDLTKKLRQYFVAPPWQGHCSHRIDEKTADDLDNLFEQYEITKSLNIKVDRSRYADSVESWIHVTYTPESIFSLLENTPANGLAILTWPNSD